MVRSKTMPKKQPGAIWATKTPKDPKKTDV